MNLDLYFAPGACSFVPHAGLEAVKAATGQEFTPKLVKLHKGEHKTPEYLAMNPNGLVPVIEDDGFVLAESNAIVRYLAARHRSPLWPEDLRRRAEAEEAEAELIESYLPAELSDEELGEFVAQAIEEVGADGPGDMGKAMGAAMPKVDGRADGKRVSAAVRERLGA